MKDSRLFAGIAASVLAILPVADAIDPLKVDEAKIRRETWEPSLVGMPTNFSGTVVLDGKPLAGVMVTDGIQFVRTGDDGR